MGKGDKVLRQFEAAKDKVAGLQHQLKAANAELDDARKKLRLSLTRGIAIEQQDEHESKPSVPDNIKKTVAAVRSIQVPVDATKLSQILEIDQAVARNRLIRASQLGLLQRVGRGQYRPAEEEEKDEEVE